MITLGSVLPGIFKTCVIFTCICPTLQAYSKYSAFAIPIMTTCSHIIIRIDTHYGSDYIVQCIAI